MRFFSCLSAALLLISNVSHAATCIGQNCALLEEIALKNGVDLSSVIENIDRNIIDPIVDSQGKMAAWEGGMLDYSASGSDGGIKIFFWGASSFNWVQTQSNFFGRDYKAEYATGIVRIGASSEIPLSQSTDLVLNGAFWSGNPDYGTGFMIGETHEKTYRIGIGIKKTYFQWTGVKIYSSSGLIFGSREFQTAYEGSKIVLRTPAGVIGWSGIEKYSDSVDYFSIPFTFGAVAKWGDVSLGVESGARYSIQGGTYQVEKFGPVGPFFGQSGFYNIGFSSSSSLERSEIWPIARINLEWNFYSDAIFAGNWSPKIGSNPHHVAGGFGWKFLTINLNQK
jgi:hypothetical protein